MTRGLDYAWTKPPAALIAGAGFGFACRYLSRDPSKNLTPAETRALQTAGVAIVVVWESGAQDMLRGHDGGVADAREALRQADTCGLHGIPVYFAADWDATSAQQAAISAYLDGAASVLGRDRVGMYGGYWPLARARAAGKAAYFWGTVAWSGDNWNPAHNPHAFTPDIMQGPQVKVAGIEVDLDDSHGRTHDGRGDDYGQYPRPPRLSGPPPHGRHEVDGTISLAGLARWCKTTPERILLLTARHQASWGDLQRPYVHAGDWAARLPAGTIVWLP